MRRTILGLTAVTAALVWAPGAGAAPPGADGLIAYTADDGGVTLIRADGSGKQSFGVGTHNAYGWSPDGRRLAFRQLDRVPNRLAVHDVLTGERVLLDLPPTSSTEIAPLDVSWSADGRSLLGTGVRLTITDDGLKQEGLVYEWRDLTPGGDPVLVASKPDSVLRFIDVSTVDGALAALHLTPQGLGFDTRLMRTSPSDPFGGAPLLGGDLWGTSYAPGGSSILVWDDDPHVQSVLRVPANGGPPVPVLAERPGQDMSDHPEYTPSGRGIVQVEDDETETGSLVLFSPAGPPDQPTAPVPNSDGAHDDSIAVQPLARTALDVDPVVLRTDPLRLGLLSFRARLTDRFGPVAGAPIRFSAQGGAPGCTATTNAQGIATCSVTLPWAQALLTLGVEARYAGDITHTPASGEAGLIK